MEFTLKYDGQENGYITELVQVSKEQLFKKLEDLDLLPVIKNEEALSEELKGKIIIYPSDTEGDTNYIICFFLDYPLEANEGIHEDEINEEEINDIEDEDLDEDNGVFFEISIQKDSKFIKKDTPEEIILSF